MIIYRCFFTEDEMFSDCFPYKESAGGILYEVEGKSFCWPETFDDSNFGANASAEEGQNEDSTTSVCDIVMKHRLKEISFDKKSYTAYIKDYIKAIKAKLEERDPERVEPFMEGATEAVERILGNLNNYKFYTGEGRNLTGHVALLGYRDDGITPYMIFFRDGLVADNY